LKSLGIRSRILLVALAPAILVAFLVSGMLVAEQMKQANSDQHRRISAVAQQLVAAARYSLFVGNQEGLVKLLESARAEPDILVAAFLDHDGKVLAISPATASLSSAQSPLGGFDSHPVLFPTEHWHSILIAAEHADEPDLFAGTDNHSPPQLGHLLLQVSTALLQDDMQRYIMTAALISSAMLLFGVLLAMALARGLIHGLTDIGHVVNGIKQGRHAQRVANPGSDELGQLAHGINLMADAVEHTQEHLAARIAEATATLRHERDEAEAAAQARSRFFAAASHDLRQPVQALGLFISRLAHDAKDSPLLPRIIRVGATVRNLQALLDTLLDFSRLDSQVFPIQLSPVHAPLAIASLVESFAAAASAKNLALRSRVTDCWLMTDPVLLHRILSNLIANAIRHSHSGEILVACRRSADHARIEVWDTGPGIPAEFHQIIFDELVQLDNPERATEKGLGLGLAIVRRTAELLHHPLSLCSRVGHGSRFAIRVPLTSPPPNPAATVAPSRALIVGAPSPDRLELASLLQHWGFAVTQLPDVESVQALIMSGDTPGVLILCAPDGAAGTTQAQAELARIEGQLGSSVAALIINSGPVPPLQEAQGASHLWLSRPFRPARLRALLSRLTSQTG